MRSSGGCSRQDIPFAIAVMGGKAEECDDVHSNTNTTILSVSGGLC